MQERCSEYTDPTGAQGYVVVPGRHQRDDTHHCIEGHRGQRTFVRDVMLSFHQRPDGRPILRHDIRIA